MVEVFGAADVTVDLVVDVRLLEDVGRTIDVKMVLVTVQLQTAQDDHLEL